MSQRIEDRIGSRARFPLAALALLPLLSGLTGCVAVGYSNRGGWFVWPGGLGLIVVIVVVLALLRRR